MSHIHAGRELFLEEMQELRVDVSRETRDQLEALVHTLVRWQKAINLVGKATLEDIWVRHVLDSAQLRSADPEERQDPGRSGQRRRISRVWSWRRCGPSSRSP